MKSRTCEHAAAADPKSAVAQAGIAFVAAGEAVAVASHFVVGSVAKVVALFSSSAKMIPGQISLMFFALVTMALIGQYPTEQSK